VQSVVHNCNNLGVSSASLFADRRLYVLTHMPTYHKRIHKNASARAQALERARTSS
jgi:hypothetical protein